MKRLADFPTVLMALRNLRRNRLRSALAALGIVIGVLAIATLGIFGNVLQLAALDSLGGLGNQVIVSPNADAGADSLTARDVAEIQRVTEGRGTAVPILSDGAVVSGPGGTSSFGTVYGTNDPGALFEAEAGTVPEQHRQGALVGTELADQLGIQVGSVVEIAGNDYRVIGVLAEGESISPVQPDDAVVLPESAFAADDYDQVVVQADSGDQARAIADDVRDRLNAREDRVSVLALSSVLDQIDEFFGLLNQFLLGLGTVSLVVAGVAIFNVMLMSTTERKGEIGLLRAVGVQKEDILRTLVVESTLLGVVGGVVGVLFSIGATLVLWYVSPIELEVVLDPSNGVYLVVAFGFGVLISLASGLYPAWKAANLEPVEALRD
ncbi:ABC transporter permease [Natronomonas marina]|uniref:ABC transporter permease n=1 Tax=Natronomonas marina TaxID=2961939 RepID=UPI0020C9C82D|nr:ABC transporter permease [Natronomonas marina]